MRNFPGKYTVYSFIINSCHLYYICYYFIITSSHQSQAFMAFDEGSSSGRKDNKIIQVRAQAFCAQALA